MSDNVIQHCECGNATYHIKRELAPQKVIIWAECIECGRPTGVMGDGMKKQREWYNES